MRPSTTRSAALVALALTAVPLAGASPAAAGLPDPKDPPWSRLAALQATSHGDRLLSASVKRTLAVPSVTSASVGVVVRDMSTGHLVHARNAAAPLSPASTAKIRTTGAALSRLGGGYTWRTEVRARGTVTSGRLSGPLVLKGYGDPTLLASDLAAMARQVRAAGITSVPGIVTDSTWFDGVRRHPSWDPAWFGSYYAAPISALTLAPDTDYDASTVIVTYAPATVGGAARVSTIPASAARYVTIRNSARTGSAGTGDSVRIAQAVDSTTITVSGSIASGLAQRKVWKVAPNPELYTATVFRAELASAGVSVTGATSAGRATTTDRVLATHRSQPLSSALVPLLKLSNNMMSEHLVKTMSAQAGGGGTWADGTARVRSWMTSARVPMSGVKVVDGSGLARANKETAISESATVWALRGNGTIYGALPVAGNPDRLVGGTLRDRMRGTAAANNLRAKTGTLSGVTALSGYVRSADGRSLSVSMLSNYSGTSPRPVEDSLAVSLAAWVGGRSPSPVLRSTTSTSAAASTAPAMASEWPKRTE